MNYELHACIIYNCGLEVGSTAFELSKKGYKQRVPEQNTPVLNVAGQKNERKI